jgi:hypothetical protein
MAEASGMGYTDGRPNLPFVDKETNEELWGTPTSALAREVTGSEPETRTVTTLVASGNVADRRRAAVGATLAYRLLHEIAVAQGYEVAVQFTRNGGKA